MAEKNNIQKALHGPSSLEVALGAVLGIAVGVVASCLYMVFKPVEKVLTMPKEPAANTVYIVAGKESGARSKGWQAKFKTVTTGGETLLREEELNAWALTLSDYKPVDPKAPKTPAPAKPAPAKPAGKDKALEPEAPADAEVFFAASAPNFSIRENRVQIALQCKLNYYGIGTDVWVKVNGRFTLTSEGYKFTPSEYYVGSCPLHLIPTAPQIMTGLILGDLKIPDDVVHAWEKISIITIEGEQLKVVTKS